MKVTDGMIEWVWNRTNGVSRKKVDLILGRAEQYAAISASPAGVGVGKDLIERVENCVLVSTPAEYAGLADHAAFEAGQDNAIANVVKMLRVALTKEATHD